MHKHQTKIEAVIVTAFNVRPPAEVAARKLFIRGVTEEDMNKVMETSVVEYVQLAAVRNALREFKLGLLT